VTLIWDAGLPGFGIIARRSGRRSWIAQYRVGRQSRRLTLGDLKTVTLLEARETAREILAMAKLGQDPHAEKMRARAALTVQEVIEGGVSAHGPFEGYLAFAKAQMRPGSYWNVELHLKQQAKALHGLPMEAVERAMIAALIRRTETRSGPTAANKLRTTLASLWKWAIATGSSPTRRTPSCWSPRRSRTGRANAS
jgi:hypothetical protein